MLYAGAVSGFDNFGGAIIFQQSDPMGELTGGLGMGVKGVQGRAR